MDFRHLRSIISATLSGPFLFPHKPVSIFPIMEGITPIIAQPPWARFLTVSSQTFRSAVLIRFLVGSNAHPGTTTGLLSIYIVHFPLALPHCSTGRKRPHFGAESNFDSCS